MKGMLAFVVMMLVSCKTPYDKAVERCKPKCYPNVVKGVEYNFSNNRYDKCICNTQLEEKELE